MLFVLLFMLLKLRPQLNEWPRFKACLSSLKTWHQNRSQVVWAENSSKWQLSQRSYQVVYTSSLWSTEVSYLFQVCHHPCAAFINWNFRSHLSRMNWYSHKIHLSHALQSCIQQCKELVMNLMEILRWKNLLAPEWTPATFLLLLHGAAPSILAKAPS